MTLPRSERPPFVTRRSLPTERLGVVRPAFTRSLAQAIVAGLRIDLVAREKGYADGAAGRGWDPGELDVIGYSTGYVEGRRVCRSKGA